MQIMEMDFEPASIRLSKEVFDEDREVITVVENDAGDLGY